MIREPEDFLPVANDWFYPTLEYVGRCIARFSSPAGSVEGPAKVSVDESGEVTVEMTPEADSLRTDRPFGLGLIRFFGGDDMVSEHGNVSSINLFAQNPCTGLEVRTPSGTFRTEEVWDYGTHSVVDTGVVTSAAFSVGRSSFEYADAGDPAYWVLPLANFLSEFRQRRPELYRHPLRVFPTPEVPDEITHVPVDHEDREELRRKAILSLDAAHSKDWLIVFGFGEGMGFIERLPGYADLERSLLEGKERHKTTSVMVGPTCDESVGDFEEMRGWFGFDVLSLLTLATGTEVGCPWVEIRDDEGGLVRRFHGYLDVKSFRKGYRLVQEMSLFGGDGTKATGRLIECALSRSRDFGRSYLRATIVHLVRARYEDLTLDDQMSHLARGFETLCKRYRTMETVLARGLSTSLRDDVRGMLEDVAARIRALKKSGSVGPEQKVTLDRIANRALGADSKDKHFGASVTKLVKAFWLPDAHILETHYQGRRGGWAGLLGLYRGDVTHHGYLPILGGNRDVEELVALRTHLHDLLARVIFRILAFDGGYNPGVITYRSAFRVDWVKPHDKAQTLGYK